MTRSDVIQNELKLRMTRSDVILNELRLRMTRSDVILNEVKDLRQNYETEKHIRLCNLHGGSCRHRRNPLRI